MNTSKSDTRGATSPPAKTNSTGELTSFFNDIEKLIKATNNLSGDDLIQATNELNARIDAAKAAAGHYRPNVSIRTGRRISRFVQENPWKTLGAGAAIAGLAGFLIARR